MNALLESIRLDSAECDDFGRLVDLTGHVGKPPRALGGERLLVPVDGSRASLNALRVAARAVGRRPGATLHLLNAQVAIGADARSDTLVDQGLACTASARALLDAAGIPYLLHLVAGPAGTAIVEHAREKDVSEIVMGADGIGGVVCAILGSVAADVIARVDQPVTLVRAGIHPDELAGAGEDWLFACDGSAAALRAARHLAGRLATAPRARRGRVHVLNVRMPGGLLPALPGRVDAAMRRQAAQECAAALDCLETAGIACLFHVESGDPVAQILRFAEDAGCGRIVMGTSGPGSLDSLIAGAVSNGVLRRAPLPVTLVK